MGDTKDVQNTNNIMDNTEENKIDLSNNLLIENQLSNVISKIDELKKIQDAYLESMKSEIVEKVIKKIDDISIEQDNQKKEIVSTVSEKEESINAKLTDLRNDIDKVLSENKNIYNASLSQKDSYFNGLLAEKEKNFASQFNNLKNEYENRIKNLEQFERDEAIRKENEFIKKSEDLKKEYENKIKDLEQSQRNELINKEKEYFVKFDNQKSEYENKISDINNSITSREEEYKKEFENLNNQKLELEQTISEKDKQITYFQSLGVSKWDEAYKIFSNLSEDAKSSIVSNTQETSFLGFIINFSQKDICGLIYEAAKIKLLNKRTEGIEEFRKLYKLIVELYNTGFKDIRIELARCNIGDNCKSEDVIILNGKITGKIKEIIFEGYVNNLTKEKKKTLVIVE